MPTNAPSTLRCPTDTLALDGSPHTIIGCGSANVIGPDDEGFYDCLSCGIFFDPAREAPLPPVDVAAAFTPASTVHAHDTVFHLSRDGVYPGTPNAVRIQTDRTLTAATAERLAALVGYVYRAEVHGEPMCLDGQDSASSIVLSTDTTKARSDDLGMALERFEAALVEVLVDGSPVRKTDRAGAGTQGTRLVDGLGPIRFAVYYDDVIATRPAEVGTVLCVVCGAWSGNLTCSRCTDPTGRVKSSTRR